MRAALVATIVAAVLFGLANGARAGARASAAGGERRQLGGRLHPADEPVLEAAGREAAPSHEYDVNLLKTAAGCTGASDWLGLLLPSIVVVSLLMLMTHFLLCRLEADLDEAEERKTAVWAQTIACFFALVDNISFSLVIPDSYSLVVGLGGSAALSGVFVGMSKFGMAFGALSTFLLMRAWPLAWMKRGREVWIGCAAANVMGAGSYAFICCFASGRWAYGREEEGALLGLLIVGRCLLGFGSGTRMMLARTLIGHLNDKHLQPVHMARFVFAIMIGLGLGPLIASGVKTLDMQFCDLQNRRFEVVGLVSLSATLCQMAMAWRFPRLDRPGIEDHGSPKHTEDELESECLEDKKVVVRLCMAFAVVRGLVISGVEVGTSMVLESEFGWTPRGIGAAEGLAFLASIPVRLLHMRYGRNLGGVACILIMLFASMCGCCLIFRIPQPVLALVAPQWRDTVQVGTLLISDAIVFPCVFHSDALNQGIMFQNLVPATSFWLSINWVSLLQSLLVDGIARSIGPPLARGTMHHDRNRYAVQQFCLALLNVLLVVFGLMPRMAKISKTLSLHSPSPSPLHTPTRGLSFQQVSRA